MKNNEMLLKVIGEADEKYIPEIDTEQLDIITSKMSENDDRSVDIRVVSQTKKNKFIKWFAVCGGLCASIMLIAKLTSYIPDTNTPSVTSMVTTSVSESMVVTQGTTAVTTTENSSTEISDNDLQQSTDEKVFVFGGKNIDTSIHLYSLDGELTENILLGNISPNNDLDYTSTELCFDEENAYIFMGKTFNMNGGGNLYFVNRHTGEIIDSVYYDSGYLAKMIYDNNKNMCYFYNYEGTATVRIFNDGLNISEAKNLTDICDLSDMNLTDAVFDGDILYCLWTNNDKCVITKIDFNNNQLIAGSEIDLNGYYINIAPSGKLYVSGTDIENTDEEMQIANIDTETLEIVDKINTGIRHNAPDNSSEYEFVMAGAGEYEFIIRRYDSVEQIEKIIAFDADTMSEKVILEVEKKPGNWFASNDVRVCNGQIIMFGSILTNNYFEQTDINT